MQGVCVCDLQVDVCDPPTPPLTHTHLQHALKMEEGSKLHLKEWLVAQIESGRYEGLCWEDVDRTMFRIPWKHAAKKDYKQTEDAALFKAWAVYKGKYREGRDKADPTMWKTRLRCALNKSTDFQEVPDRNQLDISEPYKVYRLHGDGGPATPAEAEKKGQKPARSPRRSGSLDQQDETEEKPQADDPLREHMYCEANNAAAAAALMSPSFTEFDSRMQVALFYQGHMVRKMVTRSPEGCFILQGRVPLGNEQIYGPCTAQQLSFPPPASAALPAAMIEAMTHLLCHLERGVLLWVAPDGVFIKRFCQGRVYWSGPMAPHTDRPNKLEREKTFKLLDVQTFLTALQSSSQGAGPTPSHEIELCFGEEYPDPTVPKSRKLILVQVVPMFAVKMLERFNLG